MKRRAVVVKADPGSSTTRKGRPWITLTGARPVPTRRCPAPLLLRGMGGLGDQAWSFHPTHAEALAAALTWVATPAEDGEEA